MLLILSKSYRHAHQLVVNYAFVTLSIINFQRINLYFLTLIFLNMILPFRRAESHMKLYIEMSLF